MQIIGTCGQCGGPVVNEPYMSIIPQVPRCKICGAAVKAGFGPTFEMQPASDISGTGWQEILKK